MKHLIFTKILRKSLNFCSLYNWTKITANVTQKKMEKVSRLMEGQLMRLITYFYIQIQMTVLLQPPCSPDLVPCDFFIFSKLKSMLKGRLELPYHEYPLKIYNIQLFRPKKNYVNVSVFNYIADTIQDRLCVKFNINVNFYLF